MFAKILKLFLTITSFLFFTSNLLGQEGENTFLTQAKSSYDEGNFRNALYYLNKSIESDPKNALAFKMRGDCYLDANHLNNAIKDYLTAIEIDEWMTPAYFNLAIVYEEKYLEDSAMWYYKKYNELHPKDADCLLRIAALYASSTEFGETSDSVSLYLRKAYNADHENATVVYYLAYDYMMLDMLDSALMLTEYGTEVFPEDINFFGLAGILYLKKMEFQQAINYFDKSIDLDSTALEYQLYKHTSNMLIHTTQEVYGMNHMMIPRFQDIHTKNLKKLNEWATKKENPYYYYTLKKKFLKGEEVMGLDEYFMLYYGYAQEETYSPYAMDELVIEELFNDEAYEKCFEAAEDKIKYHPSNIKAHYYKAASAYHLGKNDEYLKSLKHFHGFVSSIMATGNGEGFESAFIVVSPRDEYEVVEYQGYESKSQSLQNYQSQSFDVLEVTDDDGKALEMYFNISVPLKSLNKMFKKSGKKRKRKSSTLR